MDPNGNSSSVSAEQAQSLNSTEELNSDPPGDKIPKKYIVVLVVIIVLLFVALGFAIYVVAQNNQLKDESEEFTSQIEDLENDLDHSQDFDNYDTEELGDSIDEEDNDPPTNQDDSDPNPTPTPTPNPAPESNTTTRDISINCTNVGRSLSAKYPTDVNAESSQFFHGYGCGFLFTYDDGLLYVVHNDSYEDYYQIHDNAVQLTSNTLPGVTMYRSPLELVSSGAGSWYSTRYGVKVADSVCTSDLPGGYSLQPPCMRLGVWGSTSWSSLGIPSDKSEEERTEIIKVFDSIIKEVSGV